MAWDWLRICTKGRVIHLASIAPLAVAASASRAPSQNQEASEARSNASSQRTSDRTAPTEQDKQPEDSASQKSEDPDSTDPEGFAGLMSRALQRQTVPTGSSPRSLRIALAIPTAPKAAPKTSPNAAASDNTASVPAPADNPETLPLVFSVPAPVRSAGAFAKTDDTTQSPVSGVEAKPENAESLQIKPPSAFTARIKPDDVPESSLTTALKNTDSTLDAPKPDLASGTAGDPGASIAATAASLPNAPLHAPEMTSRAGMTGVLGASAAGPIVETAPLPPASHAEPLHNISFQLPGARGVEVRLSDQGGEIRVDVRSSDPVLTQNLRGNLHELVTGLEHRGFSAQVAHSGQASSGNSADGNSAKQQSPDEQGEGSGRRQRDRGEREQPSGERPPHSRAAWAEALNANFETPA
jgi:hypothetical protein